jgi:hypothetical protein
MQSLLHSQHPTITHYLFNKTELRGHFSWLHSFCTLARVRQRRVYANLLPRSCALRLPPLYAQDGNSNPTVHAKFFTTDSNWTWFVTEGSAEEDDFIFFGYVIGFEAECGYFALSELQSARGPLNLPTERDLYFHVGPWQEVIARYRTERGEQT